MLSRWLLTKDELPDPDPSAQGRSMIDYQLQNYKITEYGQDGRLVYSLSAPSMSRHATTEETSIEQPRLFWPQQAKSGKITAKSNSGLITGDLNIIFLRGNVVVKSQTESQQTAIIRTESLDFNQKTRLVSTPDEVTMTTAGAILTAVGMSAQLDEGIVLLEQQVKGQYETQ